MKSRVIDSLLGELIQLARAATVPGITAAQRAKREQALAERHEAVRDKISDAFDAMRARFIEARTVTVKDSWGHTRVVGGFGDVGRKAEE